MDNWTIISWLSIAISSYEFKDDIYLATNPLYTAKYKKKLTIGVVQFTFTLVSLNQIFDVGAVEMCNAIVRCWKESS